jgi:hypothetical protein
MANTFTTEERRQRAHDLGILVDQQDEWLLETYTWHLNEDGYPRTRIPGTNTLVFLHHCIVGYPIWEGQEIDHENRSRLNNHRYNLRYVDHFVQTLNRDFPTGETGERNITLRSTGMYKVQLYRYKQWIYLGQFSTLAEAVTVRDEWIDNNKENNDA